MVLVLVLFTFAVLSGFGWEGLADIGNDSIGALTAHPNPTEKSGKGR